MTTLYTELLALVKECKEEAANCDYHAMFNTGKAWDACAEKLTVILSRHASVESSNSGQSDGVALPAIGDVQEIALRSQFNKWCIDNNHTMLGQLRAVSLWEAYKACAAFLYPLWRKSDEDVDRLLSRLGLNPSDYRTDFGILNVGNIVEALKAAPTPRAEAGEAIDLLESAQAVLTTSCAPVGNPDVDDAAEIRHLQQHISEYLTKHDGNALAATPRSHEEGAMRACDATDGEVREWGERHGLDSHPLSTLRQAFEDAQTFYLTKQATP